MKEVGKDPKIFAMPLWSWQNLKVKQKLVEKVETYLNERNSCNTKQG